MLLTEGEGDALAALSALNGNALTVAAIPGVSIPVERVTAELAGAGTVYLALDGDKPGRDAADRLSRALQQFTTLKLSGSATVRTSHRSSTASRTGLTG